MAWSSAGRGSGRRRGRGCRCCYVHLYDFETKNCIQRFRDASLGSTTRARGSVSKNSQALPLSLAQPHAPLYPTLPVPPPSSPHRMTPPVTTSTVILHQLGVLQLSPLRASPSLTANLAGASLTLPDRTQLRFAASPPFLHPERVLRRTRHHNLRDQTGVTIDVNSRQHCVSFLSTIFSTRISLVQPRTSLLMMPNKPACRRSR